MVEAVELDEDEGALVAAVRPRYSQRDRCPQCRRRCAGYDPSDLAAFATEAAFP